MNWKDWVSPDFTLSKRLLGIVCVLGGIVGSLGVLAFDAVQASSDFGPTQQLALAGAIGLLLVGLSLIPLGDTPA